LVKGSWACFKVLAWRIKESKRKNVKLSL
jgi:hypothetical protein